MTKLPVLSVIVPCLNEEANIPIATQRLIEILDELIKNSEISEESFLFYVDDGSTDKTWEEIEKSSSEYKNRVKGLKFSRNFGNQKAILAGLLESLKHNTDCFITIDADLQQDETKIREFITKYKNGAKIVCGIRTDRDTDGFFKKYSALAFYKLMNMLGVNIKINHSDYRLVSREVVETLNTFPETNLFLRGIFNELGYKKDYVYFDVKPREIGKTKFTSFSLFALAISGITSFSLVPLRLVTLIGFLMSFGSFILGVSAFIDKYIRHTAVPGYATTVVSVAFIGGIQILCLGIIAEYLGQLFQEVKARPRYIVEKDID
ncbi:MAG: glycosyltransferase family 2 protein [Candidatus Gastranaerophilales bacterium]|nr:glycosyltransferase family 2 protein [Candidatus Gastranaerophilales bacterium]